MSSSKIIAADTIILRKRLMGITIRTEKKKTSDIN